MTRLYLCEKPSQARDIARILGAMRKGEGCLIGDGTAVTWCIGHLLEMAPPEAYGEQYKHWDIALLPILPKAWKVEATKAGRAQFKAVKACLAQASEVVIATDADREGETIAREVLELCRYRGPVHRLWLSALDDSSMRKGVAGYFWGCVTYPRCKATISCKDQGGGLNKASRTVTLADGRSCPKCGTGTLVQRAVKNGNFAGKRFLGCSCYPVCTYSEWSR